MARLSKKKELWNLLIPEPMVIDPSLHEEDMITSMINLREGTEMGSFIFDCLLTPQSNCVISSSEEELVDIFDMKVGDLQFELVSDKGNYVIVVRNLEKDIVGRGELIRIGKKISPDIAKKKLLVKMEGFIDRYNEGQKHINSIVARAIQLKKRWSEIQEENN